MLNASHIILPWLRSQDLAQSRASQREYLSDIGWWAEVAGTFIIAPRQVGKTTALRSFMEQLKELRPNERIVIVSPYQVNADRFTDTGNINLVGMSGTSWLDVVNVNTDHLVMDEFLSLEKSILDTVLNRNWLSVTGIGSLR